MQDEGVVLLYNMLRLHITRQLVGKTKTSSLNHHSLTCPTGRIFGRPTGGTFVRRTKVKIVPGVATSLTISIYPTSSCSDMDAEYITVGTKYINSNVCFNGNTRLYANMTALPTPTTPSIPVIDVESMTREQIMFPDWLWEPTPRQVFVTD
ncbi:unnamed protein product [Phytophthora lilii]|uniref:Unnamed protein product n=1 Tax=Phytophthora lilii TaxID=2077276 RepID=A0A9W6TK84_9STRA|nr:unnamed protein product [Phytophthora lilii]